MNNKYAKTIGIAGETWCHNQGALKNISLRTTNKARNTYEKTKKSMAGTITSSAVNTDIGRLLVF